MATQKKIKEAIALLRMEGYATIDNHSMRCTCCGKYKSTHQGNFWQAYSSIYKGNTATHKYIPKGADKAVTEDRSWFPICKKCAEVQIGNGDEKNIVTLLKFMDRPFLQETWQNAWDKHSHKAKPITVFGYYMSNISLNHKDLAFEDSDELEDENTIKDTTKKTKLSLKEKKELQEKWGTHYTDHDLVFLRDGYRNWTTRHKCDEYSEEILYEQISLKQLEIRNGRAKMDNVDRQIEALQKLMSSANVKPIDMDASKNTENVNALGLWILDIEKYRPAEYFEDKPLYEDVDKIKEYCDRFILRPLKNLLLGTRDFDFLYNLEDTKVEEVSYQDEDDRKEGV